jgi:hypothetical protein
MDELNKNQAERIRVSGILRNTTVMPQFRHEYFGDTTSSARAGKDNACGGCPREVSFHKIRTCISG